jgi:hypothetical protein
LRHAGAVSSLELALVSAGAALAGVVLGGLGNAWRDRIAEYRTRMRERDRAIAELLTAVADLMSGIQVVRATYDRSRARGWVRRVGQLWTAVSVSFADEDKITRETLLDWRKRAPMVGQLLAIDQGLLDQQRAIVMDVSTVLLSPTSRFYGAITVLTLGPDEKIAAAVRELTPAVTGLLGVIGASDGKYARARSRAEAEFARFRDVADQRRR